MLLALPSTRSPNVESIHFTAFRASCRRRTRMRCDPGRPAETASARSGTCPPRLIGCVAVHRHGDIAGCAPANWEAPFAMCRLPCRADIPIPVARSIGWGSVPGLAIQPQVTPAREDHPRTGSPPLRDKMSHRHMARRNDVSPLHARRWPRDVLNKSTRNRLYALPPSPVTPYISCAGLPAMAINGRRNKPFGPGGSTRRLHHSPGERPVIGH
jgi:hypothetical protein